MRSTDVRGKSIKHLKRCIGGIRHTSIAQGAISKQANSSSIDTDTDADSSSEDIGDTGGIGCIGDTEGIGEIGGIGDVTRF